MKAEYVIRQLFSELPKHSDLFSDTIPMSSIVASLGVVTVTTAVPHGLVNNDYVTIQGITIENPIVSLTQINGIASAETANNHDLTENWQDQVEIQGANEALYNGMHDLLTVPSRTTFTYAIDPLAPPVATGSIFLRETICLTFNGSFQITVTSPTTFTYTALDPNLTAIGIILPESFLRANHRVSGAVDLERMILSYTKQGNNKLWLFVVLGNVDVNRERSINTDVSALNSNESAGFRQRLILEFSIYAVTPSTQSIAGRYERDLMHDVFIAINKSLLLAKFRTGTSIPETSGVTTLGHGFANYANAYYVHEFRYQMTQDIIYQSKDANDTAGGPCTRAWRDVYLDRLNNNDVIIQQTYINLDG